MYVGPVACRRPGKQCHMQHCGTALHSCTPYSSLSDNFDASALLCNLYVIYESFAVILLPVVYFISWSLRVTCDNVFVESRIKNYVKTLSVTRRLCRDWNMTYDWCPELCTSEVMRRIQYTVDVSIKLQSPVHGWIQKQVGQTRLARSTSGSNSQAPNLLQATHIAVQPLYFTWYLSHYLLNSVEQFVAGAEGCITDYWTFHQPAKDWVVLTQLLYVSAKPS